ncbi:hypothetical protein GS416_06935 [Rhodococcus hoagii]|nr:hypothetical protein [Prescottella equi]
MFAPATATAEAPLRLPDHITDTAGVLDAGQRADVQNALDTLYDEHKVSLWVVYTRTSTACRVRHGRADGEAERTRQQGRVARRRDDGPRLLAGRAGRVVGGHRLRDPVDHRGSVQPALREQDWAGAAIAAAGGLGDAMTATNTSLKVLGVGIGVVVVAGAGVYLYSRKKRGDRLESSIAQARQVDPTDAAALSALPIPALDALAKDELVEMDNAIRTSEEELNLAVGEFGADATAPFTAAYDRAKATLASAFAIRQRLDDDIPRRPSSSGRCWSNSSRPASAPTASSMPVSEFDAMRDLLLDAPADSTPSPRPWWPSPSASPRPRPRSLHSAVSSRRRCWRPCTTTRPWHANGSPSRSRTSRPAVRPRRFRGQAGPGSRRDPRRRGRARPGSPTARRGRSRRHRHPARHRDPARSDGRRAGGHRRRRTARGKGRTELAERRPPRRRRCRMRSPPRTPTLSAVSPRWWRPMPAWTPSWPRHRRRTGRPSGHARVSIRT